MDLQLPLQSVPITTNVNICLRKENTNTNKKYVVMYSLESSINLESCIRIFVVEITLLFIGINKFLLRDMSKKNQQAIYHFA